MKAVKQLVRTISAVPNDAVGTDSVESVNHELAVYFEGGWTLFHTQAVSQVRADITMLYVLTKEEIIVPMKNIMVEDVLEAGVVQHAKRGRPAKHTIENETMVA